MITAHIVKATVELPAGTPLRSWYTIGSGPAAESAMNRQATDLILECLPPRHDDSASFSIETIKAVREKWDGEVYGLVTPIAYAATLRDLVVDGEDGPWKKQAGVWWLRVATMPGFKTTTATCAMLRSGSVGFSSSGCSGSSCLMNAGLLDSDGVEVFTHDDATALAEVA